MAQQNQDEPAQPHEEIPLAIASNCPSSIDVILLLFDAIVHDGVDMLKEIRLEILAEPPVAPLARLAAYATSPGIITHWQALTITNVFQRDSRGFLRQWVDVLAACKYQWSQGQSMQGLCKLLLVQSAFALGVKPEDLNIFLNGVLEFFVLNLDNLNYPYMYTNLLNDGDDGDWLPIGDAAYTWEEDDGSEGETPAAHNEGHSPPVGQAPVEYPENLEETSPSTGDITM